MVESGKQAHDVTLGKLTDAEQDLEKVNVFVFRVCIYDSRWKISLASEILIYRNMKVAGMQF